jgi:hypothetical protein
MYPPPLLNLNQMNSIHNFQRHFPKIRFNIILRSTPRSLKRSLPFKLSNQSVLPISHFPLAWCMFGSSRPFKFDDPNNICWRIKIILLLPVFCKRQKNSTFKIFQVIKSAVFSLDVTRWVSSPQSFFFQMTYNEKLFKGHAAKISASA